MPIYSSGELLRPERLSDLMRSEVDYAHARFSCEEISRRDKELYKQRIRALVETEANIGNIVSIDIETGDYEVGNDLIALGDLLYARHPAAALYGQQSDTMLSIRSVEPW